MDTKYAVELTGEQLALLYSIAYAIAKGKKTQWARLWEVIEGLEWELTEEWGRLFLDIERACLGDKGG